MMTKLSSIDFSGFTTMEQLFIHEMDGRPLGASLRVNGGEKWGYGWFRSMIVVPQEAEGKRLVALLDFGSEATVY